MRKLPLLLSSLLGRAAATGDDAAVLLQMGSATVEHHQLGEADLMEESDELVYPFKDSEPGSPEGATSLDLRPKHSCVTVTPTRGTMKSRHKIEANINIMVKMHEDGIQGDIVEAGVAAGGGVLPIIYYLACTGDLRGRTVHLFDTWEGLPEPVAEVDKVGFKKGLWHKSYEVFLDTARRYGDAYRENVESRARPFDEGEPIATWEEVMSHVSINKGLFADTMPRALATADVALLLCDGDMYQSTVDCFHAAGPRLVPGATVYNDDYYSYIGCYRATKEFIAARRQSGKRVGSVSIVSNEVGDLKYFDEDKSYCVPPEDNVGDGPCGKCDGVYVEAAVFTCY